VTGAVRVVVVEDSPVQRAHLVDVLQAERDIDVVGQAGDPVEAVALVQRLRPDVVAMDLGLAGGRLHRPRRGPPEAGPGAGRADRAHGPAAGPPARRPPAGPRPRAGGAAPAVGGRAVRVGGRHHRRAERGLLALRRQGAFTIAQDEPTSVVFGMPQAARRLGAAGEILGLDRIPRGIRRAIQRLAVTTAGASEADGVERVRQ
jgi:CheB methylesterase/Response regulator receiver domain